MFSSLKCKMYVLYSKYYLVSFLTCLTEDYALWDSNPDYTPPRLVVSCKCFSGFQSLHSFLIGIPGTCGMQS